MVEKRKMVEKMLIDFEFTDETRKVLKAVHLNFDNLAEEAGYILKEKAIPIEWIKQWCVKHYQTYPTNYPRIIIKELLEKTETWQMIEDWEKENE